jgi:hypothetical protein
VRGGLGDHDGRRVTPLTRHAEREALDSAFGGQPGGAAGKPELGTPIVTGHDLDRGPSESFVVTPQCLHRRLLGGKARGQLRGATPTIAPFPWGVHALEETVTVLTKRLLDLLHGDEVDSDVTQHFSEYYRRDRQTLQLTGITQNYPVTAT